MGLAAVRPASLSHIRATATTFAAQHLSTGPDEIDGVVRVRQIVRHADGNAGFAILCHANYGDDAGADFLLPVVNKPAEILRLEPFDFPREQLDVADGADAVRSSHTIAARAQRELAFGIRQLSLQRPPLLHQRLDAIDQVIRPYPKHICSFAHAIILLIEVSARAIASQRLDAAHTGSGRAFGNNPDNADVA